VSLSSARFPPALDIKLKLPFLKHQLNTRRHASEFTPSHDARKSPFSTGERSQFRHPVDGAERRAHRSYSDRTGVVLARTEFPHPGGVHASADIFDYIEVFYNRIRRHSHLGGISPEAFERASA